MKYVWCGIAAVGAVVLLYVVVTAPGNDLEQLATEEVAYLCRETGELVKAPRQPTPAVNPKTGRPTLDRALFCPECDKWQPIPSSDAFNGDPLSHHCPRHRAPMLAAKPSETNATDP